MKTLALASMICALLALTGCADEKLALPSLSPEQRAELQEWLDEHAASPEEYVASKFAHHDIVFLGEYHRIRHDALLVQNLIPVLHRTGIHNLGLEFLAAADQDDIDRLLAADTYDDSLARDLFWRAWPWWGFREYVDILRVAWELNHSLHEGAGRFRVLGLNARQDWSHVWTEEDRANPEVMSRVWPEGESDAVMAETIRRDILSHGGKALIYAGINHAYTRFRQPVVDETTGELVRLVNTRMGNLIADEIGERAFTIFLHSPWPSAAGYAAPWVYPADGIIDAFFLGIPEPQRRVGFDVAGSPIGRLPGGASLWSLSTPDFRIEHYCDGWIYQMPLSRYEGVTAIPDWFNEQNRLDAIAQLANPDPRVKDTERTVEQLTAFLAGSTGSIGRLFARFRQ